MLSRKEPLQRMDVSIFRTADDFLALYFQRFVQARAEAGISLPCILRDAVTVTSMSLLFSLGVAIWEMHGTATVLLGVLALAMAPMELRQWRKHAERARRDWSDQIAAACLREAESSKIRFLPFRIVFAVTIVWLFFAAAAYPFTATDGACLGMNVIFFVRLYLERSHPVPPSLQEDAFADVVPGLA